MQLLCPLSFRLEPLIVCYQVHAKGHCDGSPTISVRYMTRHEEGATSRLQLQTLLSLHVNSQTRKIHSITSQSLGNFNCIVDKSRKDRCNAARQHFLPIHHQSDVQVHEQTTRTCFRKRLLERRIQTQQCLQRRARRELKWRRRNRRLALMSRSARRRRTIKQKIQAELGASEYNLHHFLLSPNSAGCPRSYQSWMTRLLSTILSLVIDMQVGKCSRSREHFLARTRKQMMAF